MAGTALIWRQGKLQALKVRRLLKLACVVNNAIELTRSEAFIRRTMVGARVTDPRARRLNVSRLSCDELREATRR